MYDANFMKIVRSTNLYLSKSSFSNYALCVSGGVDSMVLLQVFQNLKLSGDIEQFRVLHVNHGTRVNCHEEERFLNSYCYKNGIKFEVFHNKKDVKNNIEKDLREARYDYFYNNLENNEALVLAHHLDDDVEWNLMQSLKTSSIGPALYIPNSGDRMLRPVLSIRKVDLIEVAKGEVRWFEDYTNKDEKFERNYVRNSLVPIILKGLIIFMSIL